MTYIKMGTNVSKITYMLINCSLYITYILDSKAKNSNFYLVNFTPAKKTISYAHRAHTDFPLADGKMTGHTLLSFLACKRKQDTAPDAG